MNREWYYKIANTAIIMEQVLHVFPYINYLVTFFPFFIILLDKGFLNYGSLLLFTPLISTMVAGFSYNTICDAKKDPPEKNPITSKKISEKWILYFSFVSVICSVILFVSFYTTHTAILLSVVYIILWLAYSGLKIRFKESYIGPAIASFVLWSGGPMILLAEFNYFTPVTSLLLIGTFFFYLGFEINHTVGDYELDLNHNCRTFAVRLGKKKAVIVKHIAMLLGYTFLLVAAYLVMPYPFVAMFLLLFPISQMSMAICDTLDYKLAWKAFSKFFFMSPFFMTKSFFVLFGLILLNLPTIYFLLAIWVFLTDKKGATI